MKGFEDTDESENGKEEKKSRASIFFSLSLSLCLELQKLVEYLHLHVGGGTVCAACFSEINFLTCKNS